MSKLIPANKTLQSYYIIHMQNIEMIKVCVI